MLYEQKCTQPGKQTAKTAIVHVFAYLHILNHFDYSAVVGQFIQIGYCNGWLLQERMDVHSSGKTYQEDDKRGKGEMKEWLRSMQAHL